MNIGRKKKFIRLWKQYCDAAELPVAFYYSDREGGAKLVKHPSAHQCVIAVLSQARKGESICFGAESVGCGGGSRYLGFTANLRPNFEYFLSCGIPGELEGERYKKSPELVREIMKRMPDFKAPGRFIVFKRWDMLDESDEPAVAIFFAKPDVLAGLFTLANFDEAEQNGVIAPFGAGCSSIVMYPYLERDAERPRAVLGMFDVSARPFVPRETLTFSVPMNKFDRMIDNMEQSFLTTPSWAQVRKRIAKA